MVCAHFTAFFVAEIETVAHPEHTRANSMQPAALTLIPDAKTAAALANAASVSPQDSLDTKSLRHSLTASRVLLLWEQDALINAKVDAQLNPGPDEARRRLVVEREGNVAKLIARIRYFESHIADIEQYDRYVGYEKLWQYMVGHVGNIRWAAEGRPVSAASTCADAAPASAACAAGSNP